MNRQARRNALIVALIGAAGAVVAAVITVGPWKNEPKVLPASQPRLENRAETKGDRSPAVADAKGDVVISYGDEKGKAKPKE